MNAEARIAALEQAILLNIGTMEFTVARHERWGKSHDELDLAIKESRAALSSDKPERTDRG